MILGRFGVLGIFGDPNQQPRIQLNGPNPIRIRQGRVWMDPGATVTDDNDGVLQVQSGVPVNTAVPATYILPYNYIDSGGLVATTVSRTVIVEPLDKGNEAISFLVTAG